MISYCDKYIQIRLPKNSLLLRKVINYANKHFSQNIKLSSSVLILDDGETYKKEYLLQWCIHASAPSLESKALDLVISDALKRAHLPLHIKITGEAELLERVHIRASVLGVNRMLLKMEKENFVAKRYIKLLFQKYCLSDKGNEIYLNATGEEFWDKVINLISFKVIHNVLLVFEFNDFMSKEKFERSINQSFLTKEERELRRSYSLLDSTIGDDFSTIKSRYLKLVRTYHPDTVYGKNKEIVDAYITRFRAIKEAYEVIKNSSKVAS
ncbi:J domain-containing protein [Helicobacter sp. 11S02629-2]|uniref:J domain-containing protein n=1 Tax=Helicobacter sp. 11S02629-2 TaxID=1476195 RepID=UPI000BA725DC|nr:J domain-containing protein [Helicobacter sp. 11S02629-2]PAF43112.1 hypothetical protein BKH40_07290 [Helicobacter sp. 11S02629-2]